MLINLLNYLKMSRLFTCNYNKFFIACLGYSFLAVFICCLLYTNYLVVQVTSLTISPAVYKFHNETSFKVYYKSRPNLYNLGSGQTDNEKLYIKYCEYMNDDNIFSYINKHDVLVRPDNTIICPYDNFMFFLKFISVGFALIILIPSSIIIAYDFIQFKNQVYSTKKT
jgi:hypothetical protein